MSALLGSIYILAMIVALGGWVADRVSAVVRRLKR